LRREGYDWRSSVRALPAPTLVLHGTEDALPPALSADLSYIFSNYTFVAVPSSGHMPFWEAPERFFSLIDSFL
jgi:pimeloyl-ACP methyl ester carboxylesterase